MWGLSAQTATRRCVRSDLLAKLASATQAAKRREVSRHSTNQPVRVRRLLPPLQRSEEVHEVWIERVNCQLIKFPCSRTLQDIDA
mmetsp:Transcript_62750/g.99495  ORF Transcript_62750/g.99495 Transcript_62750/m.99495 type:complete len:85 (-) Transcript_62750:165-419(-)